MAITNKEQFKNGKNVEAWLDDFFQRRGWYITVATKHEERVLCLGDRRFKKIGYDLWIEYKSGIQTFYSGNIFLETVSVDSENKPGWVYTCKADYIFYATLLNHKILVFTPTKLRSEIEYLKSVFPTRPTKHHQNDGYNTHGVIIPLDYAEKNLTEKIIDLYQDAA